MTHKTTIGMYVAGFKPSPPFKLIERFDYTTIFEKSK